MSNRSPGYYTDTSGASSQTPWPTGTYQPGLAYNFLYNQLRFMREITYLAILTVLCSFMWWISNNFKIDNENNLFQLFLCEWL